jgi:hypothetical protein
VAVQYAHEHRCGVRVRGPGMTDAITGTDPLKDALPLLEVCRPAAQCFQLQHNCTRACMSRGVCCSRAHWMAAKRPSALQRW